MITGIALVMAAGLWLGLKNHGKPKTFEQRIIVHGTDGLPHRVLRNQGKVVLNFGPAVFESPIDQNGEAFFPAIASQYINQPARISLLFAEPYQPQFPDSAYLLLPTKTISLAVKTSGEVFVSGRITDQITSLPLDSVRINCGTYQAWTDASGNFSLPLPSHQLKPSTEIVFSKQHYQDLVVKDVSLHLSSKFTLYMVPLP
jgi:hypothetical protein